MIKLLVFDLDGTLIDSVRDIARAVNHVRESCGRAPRDVQTVQDAIGKGAPYLFSTVNQDFLEEGDEFDRRFEQFVQYYRQTSIEHSEYYPGTEAFLARARERYQLAMLTNKPLAITEAIVQAKELAAVFERILCPENAARKPDPAGLLRLLEELQVGADEALMIGDSVNDFEAGQRAGVRTIGLRHGYHKPGGADPDLWLDDIPALETWLFGASS